MKETYKSDGPYYWNRLKSYPRQEGFYPFINHRLPSLLSLSHLHKNFSKSDANPTRRTTRARTRRRDGQERGRTVKSARWVLLTPRGLLDKQYPCFNSVPFVASIYPPRNLMIRSWLWIGVVLFPTSLSFLLLPLEILEILPCFVVAVEMAVLATVIVTLRLLLLLHLWNGIGLGGTGISLKWNRLKALPLFSRCGSFCHDLCVIVDFIKWGFIRCLGDD